MLYPMAKCLNQGTRTLFPKPLAFSSWPFVYVGVTFCSLCVPVLSEHLLSVVSWELGCFVGIYCQACRSTSVSQAVGIYCVSGPGLLCGHALCEHLL